MDIKKLASLDSKTPTVQVEDSSFERRAAKEFLSNGRKRIEDSVMPVKSEDRKRWAARCLRDVLSNVDLSVEDTDYIVDSVENILKKYEDKCVRISDSFSKSKSELMDLKKKLDTQADVLKSYKELGTVSQISKKIADADYVLEDKQKREEEAAQREKDLEEKNKQLEDDKKRLEEEKKRLEEEKAKADAQTVTVQDSKKTYRLKFKKVKDAKIEDDLSVKKDLLSKFAATFEDWIQTGSSYIEEKLKQTAEVIGDENIKTLVDKATNYEPLDDNTYEDLTSDLKAALQENGLKIPSLALIKDSAVLENLEKKGNPIKDVPLSDVVLSIQNFTISPNPETRAKVKSYSDRMEDSVLKKKTQELLWMVFDGYVSESALNLSREIESIAKRKGEKVQINFRKFDDVPLTFPTANSVVENKPVESVMTHVQYQAVFDSKERFEKIRDYVRVQDCNECACASCDPCVEVQSVTPVEGTGYLAITIQGVTRLHVLNEGVNPLTLMSRINNSYGQERWNVVCENTTPLEPILQIAQSTGQYDLVTDSSLYKRHSSDKYWVSETMQVKDSIEVLNKLVRLVDSFKQLEEIRESLDGYKKVRFVVSDSVENFPVEESMKTIVPKKLIDFKGKTNIRLYLA